MPAVAVRTSNCSNGMLPPTSLRHRVHIHAAVIDPSNFSVLICQRGPANLDLNSRTAVSRRPRGFTTQMV
eukprot:2131513-Lingulodinium_polyedra.AAC.1